MIAGLLRERVTILQSVPTQNSYGEVEAAWQVLAEVWGRYEVLRGREFFDARQMQEEVTARVTIRYRSDVAVGMRLRVRGTEYRITAVIPDERRKELQLMCEAVG